MLLGIEKAKEINIFYMLKGIIEHKIKYVFKKVKEVDVEIINIQDTKPLVRDTIKFSTPLLEMFLNDNNFYLQDITTVTEIRDGLSLYLKGGYRINIKKVK